LGKCRKRGSCNFAHSEEEMSDLPDLRCTKMCPKVLEGGKCDALECQFAHTESEIRGSGAAKMQELQQSQQHADDEPQLLQDGDASPGPCPTESGTSYSSEECFELMEMLVSKVPSRLRVKNTFIEVEEDFSDEVVTRPRRADTMPHACRMPLCPALISTGHCSERLCRFSHETDSLDQHPGAFANASGRNGIQLSSSSTFKDSVVEGGKDSSVAKEAVDSPTLPMLTQMDDGDLHKNEGVLVGLQEPRGPQSPLRKKGAAASVRTPLPSIREATEVEKPPTGSTNSRGSSVSWGEEDEDVDRRWCPGSGDLDSYGFGMSDQSVADDDDEDDIDGLPLFNKTKTAPCVRSDMRSITLCVKNTFLDIDEEEPATPGTPMALPPKAKSATF